RNQTQRCPTARSGATICDRESNEELGWRKLKSQNRGRERMFFELVVARELRNHDDLQLRRDERFVDWTERCFVAIDPILRHAPRRSVVAVRAGKVEGLEGR